MKNFLTIYCTKKKKVIVLGTGIQLLLQYVIYKKKQNLLPFSNTV